MGIATLLTGGIAGFLSAVFSGLIFGLTVVECAAVYSVIALIVATTIFAVRGLFCAAARQLA